MQATGSFISHIDKTLMSLHVCAFSVREAASAAPKAAPEMNTAATPRSLSRRSTARCGSIAILNLLFTVGWGYGAAQPHY